MTGMEGYQEIAALDGYRTDSRAEDTTQHRTSSSYRTSATTCCRASITGCLCIKEEDICDMTDTQDMFVESLSD